jgi:threonine/homoserine/homoserine lactone efflux protein
MSTIIAMGLFSLSMSISPGPVNLIALSSGIRLGFMRSMMYVSGATIGFTLLLFAVGLGVGALATASPLFMNTLTFVGSGYIAYMGYKILKSTEPLKRSENTSSSFIHGFVLQWLNPKAWIACVSGVAAFDASYIDRLLLFVLIYFLICYASIASWAFAGDRIGDYLGHGKYLRIFNITLGGLLILVAAYLISLQFAL